MTICGPNQQLTPDQVAQFMQNAGFPTAVIPVGIAVAMGESGLESGNCNLNDPNGGSFGLWQINGAHFNSGATTQACAFDPQCATNFAFELWKGNGWNPWGAYTNGSYRQYLNNQNLTLPGGGGNSSGGNQQQLTLTQTTAATCTCDPGYTVVKNNLGQDICRNNNFPFDSRPCRERQAQDPLTQIANVLSIIGQWISDPVRIIKLIFGIVLIGGAIFLLASPEGQIAQQASRFSKQAGLSRLQGGKG